jgi:hypothetical protein
MLTPITVTHHVSMRSKIWNLNLARGPRGSLRHGFVVPFRGCWLLGKLRTAVDRIANGQPETVKRRSGLTCSHLNGIADGRPEAW